MQQDAPPADVVEKSDGEIHRHSAAAPDWKNNWVSNIAIKITATLLWFLVFIGTAVSFLLYGDIDSKIRSTLNNYADHHAYAASRILASKEPALDPLVDQILKSGSDTISFTAVHIQLGTQEWRYGRLSDSGVKLSRPLLVPTATPTTVGTIHLYHLPIRALIKKERIRLMISASLPLVLLGIALALLVNRIVVRPIQNLVLATRRIAEGDMSFRINSKREDEFGHLEDFFDDMLDQLQEQKDQLQNALESAQAADRIKSQFLANMSHELRTPLNAIIGYSELMMESLGDAKEKRNNYQDDLERIRSSGRHLLTLINDVLDIAKIEAGKMKFTRVRFKVKDMIDEVSATAMPLMLQNNNQVKIVCPDTIGEMESDEIRIRQVLINLLSNAAKFTHEGHVQMSVERFSVDDNDWYRFTVEDDGIGISENDSQRLFNEFAQVEDHINGKPVGTGLGLAITRKFCNLMGGNITLDSTLGVGSKFIVELPKTLP